MPSTGPETRDSNLQPIESASLQELNHRVGDTVSELYQLLELYAPAWYTEELHQKAEAALLAIGCLSRSSDMPRPQARDCRNIAGWHGE